MVSSLVIDVDESSASGRIATVAVNVHHVEFQIGYDTRGS
jgi:hypothetical protein